MTIRPDLSTLSSMMIGQIASLPADTLLALKSEADALYDDIVRKREWINGALEIKYGEQARQARLSLGKGTGVVHLIDGEVSVTADLPKRVKWDQSRLATIHADIAKSGDDPSQYIDIAYGVSERRYDAWPEGIRNIFAPARTVETGKPSFKLVRKEGEQ